MGCSISELREKEVIDVKTGKRIGYPYDFRIDLVCGQLTALVVPSCDRKIGKNKDLVIPWECITRIGEDAILVNVPHCPGECEAPACAKKKLFGLF